MKAAARVANDDVRVIAPIFTPAEVSAITGMTKSRAYDWSQRELITSVPARRRGWPTIPLIGLVEYETFLGMRQARMPMEEVAAVAKYIRSEIDEFGFLNQEIVHDGTVAYFRDHEELERVVNGQYAFFAVVREYLRPFEMDDDGLVFRYRVERLAGVVIDPRFNAGRMMFEDSGVPLFAVAGLLSAGETVEVVAGEFGITPEQAASVKADLSWVSEAA
jgi:uncharacterized protein (DUF433 family)